MTRIHHATARKATEQGVELSIVEETGAPVGVKAIKGKSFVFHTDARHALEWALLAETLRLEYPALQVISGEPSELPTIFYSPESEMLPFHGEVAPTLAQVQEMCEELGFDPEADVEADVEADADQEEEAPRGGVVHARYRAAYAQRGNPAHCGDWLAGWLDGQFESAWLDAEGRKQSSFDADAFAAFLSDNGVPLDGKWAALPTSGQRGWQGRYRMNGRQILEKYVALNGKLQCRGETIEVPAEFVAALQAKHANWLDKQRKGA